MDAQHITLDETVYQLGKQIYPIAISKGIDFEFIGPRATKYEEIEATLKDLVVTQGKILSTSTKDNTTNITGY